jgi:hypothetical protein
MAKLILCACHWSRSKGLVQFVESSRAMSVVRLLFFIISAASTARIEIISQHEVLPSLEKTGGPFSMAPHCEREPTTGGYAQESAAAWA